MAKQITEAQRRKLINMALVQLVETSQGRLVVTIPRKTDTADLIIQARTLPEGGIEVELTLRKGRAQ